MTHLSRGRDQGAANPRRFASTLNFRAGPSSGHLGVMTPRTPNPSIVLVLNPMEVARWQQLDEFQGWWIAGTVSTTRPAERAVVYRTTSDRGIAGVFDFATRAFRHPDLGWAAFGRPLALAAEVPRSTLLRHGALEPVFRRIQGRRRLPREAALQITRIIESLPPWQSVDDALPDFDSEDWTWLPAREDTGWGIEGAMRDAICSDELSWSKLGFPRAPEREIRPPGSRLRMDLFSPGVVGECKLVAGMSTLRQLDGYLRLQRERGVPQGWVGHIIVALGYSDPLATAVFAREDIRLWVCRRSDDGTPTLIEITRRRPMP